MRRVWRGIACLLLSIAFSPSNSIAAGFSTNFQPSQSDWQPSESHGYCVFASTNCSLTQLGNGDPTPFEYNVVNVDGQWYFHTIVGDPATGFAIEAYTPWGAGPAGNPGNINGGDYSPAGGGNETSVIGMGGLTNGDYIQGHTNAGNAFSNVHASGSGSQDPSKAVIRMILTSADGTMSMEYFKSFLDRKPLISQTIEDGGMSGAFSVDMRAIGYQDMNTPLDITNNLSVVDPNIPDGSGNFEMALAQAPDITAGRYTFAAGSGWNNPDGWHVTGSSFGLGTYTYLDGAGFDPYTFDWGSVFDHAQNGLNCARKGLGSQGVYRDALDSTAFGGGKSCPN